MSKSFKVILVLIIAIFTSIFVHIYKFEEYLIPTLAIEYIKKAGCQAVNGKPKWNCVGRIECEFPAKDYGKSCNNSEDCKYNCVINDSSVNLYCHNSTSAPKYSVGKECSGISGRCEKYLGESDYRYEDGYIFDNMYGCAQ
ncbi:MAG: hypothetical protein HYT15_03245 [Candidatus Magasanikbacteria bacterium]|nr:hypothetical protein [Candidatus Magasanikbacteria bacterium]